MRHLLQVICLGLVLLTTWVSSLTAQIPEPGLAKEKLTISGYIKDAASGETLIGASIFVPEIQNGTTTNAYGFYSLSLPPARYTLSISYLGYRRLEAIIDLDIQNIRQDYEMQLVSAELEEVIVTSDAEDRNVSELQMSVNRLDIGTIQKLPTLLGEVEILRSILLLPGVTTVGEGASGFNVRGGSIDQNLVLLDEAPVYNSSHLFGFYSVFNPDAVKDVQLFKGGIPSRYGGRLSSILDVRMKEGNNKKFELNGGVGFIFSRLSVEAPIIKDKASFIVAARRSYIDVLARPFLNEDFDGSALNFYDLTAKTNWSVNENNHLFLSGYFGRDNFRFGEAAGFDWGNGTATLRWNHLFSERLFSNITLYYSDYDYEIHFGEDATNKFDWEASIVNYSIKPELAYYVNPSNLIRFGGHMVVYDFLPGKAIGVSEGEVTDFSLPSKYAIESSVFVENELNIAPGLEVNYGIRLSHFNYTGKGFAYAYGETSAGERRPLIDTREFTQWESIQTYLNPEPRIAIKYEISHHASVKLSYNRMAQYVHLISNTTASTPVDVWTPSTNNLKPQLADQFAAGFFRNFDDNMYEISIETYYKRMQRLVDYIDGADLILNPLIEGDLLSGEGRAYGLESQFSKTEGRWTGWISYTLARTERRVEGINAGKWYPSRYDQLHNLSVTTFYDLSKRWTFSASFAFNSGTPSTFPTSRIEQQGYVIPHNASDGRNNARVPVYHRLDVSLTLNPKEKPGKKWHSEWVFSVYNVYNRRNPFSIYFRQDPKRVMPDIPIMTEAVKLSVIGNFIPSVSYNFKFN
ncbi:MAG TPA: TonB-dependent receptor [Saprospiraceae bacterium]|nr:TonB-dependent receptor [Saprospiraceae bacterium]